jgi:hypothetical protein
VGGQRRRPRLILHVNLGGRQDSPNVVEELERILLGPEVDIERVEGIVVFILVMGIVGR